MLLYSLQSHSMGQNTSILLKSENTCVSWLRFHLP